MKNSSFISGWQKMGRNKGWFCCVCILPALFVAACSSTGPEFVENLPEAVSEEELMALLEYLADWEEEIPSAPAEHWRMKLTSAEIDYE